jgi:hypothetical protein
MEYRYYRYRLEGAVSAEEASRIVGQTGAMIVRIDSREGGTEVTVATATELRLPPESPFGIGVEVSEQDVRRTGGS